MQKQHTHICTYIHTYTWIGKWIREGVKSTFPFPFSNFPGGISVSCSFPHAFSGFPWLGIISIPQLPVARTTSWFLHPLHLIHVFGTMLVVWIAFNHKLNYLTIYNCVQHQTVPHSTAFPSGVDNSPTNDTLQFQTLRGLVAQQFCKHWGLRRELDLFTKGTESDAYLQRK